MTIENRKIIKVKEEEEDLIILRKHDLNSNIIKDYIKT